MYNRFFPELFSGDESLHMMGQGSMSALADTIEVLVWNIYKGRYKTWAADFCPLIKEKDLVLLQESVLNTAHDPIFQNPERFEWVMARTYKHRKTLAATGVKTGSAVSSSSQRYFVSPDVEPFFKTPKMLLATTYPFLNSSEKLLTLNIHAINFVSFAKYKRQVEQIVGIIEAHTGPVILAGDFNTWNGLRYKTLLDITKSVGLEEAVLTRPGRWQHLNRHLDHIYYRGLELKKTEVLFNIRTSDHYPITATFSLPKS